MRCTYCFEHGHFDKKQKPSDELTKNIKEKIDYAISNKEFLRNFDGFCINFWGGEPTLNQDFIEELINYYKENNRVHFFIYTNGYHFTERFILLGRSNTEEGNQIKSLINEKQLNCRFIVFDGFVPDTIFNDYLFSSDIIMPLIHPNIKGFANYLKNKITGTMNIAYAFEKPMLYHQDLHLLPEFSNHGIPYEAATLFEKLNALAEGTIELPICKNVNQQEQREKYLAFIS
jgi:organic radical activating enzyme